MPKNVKKGKNSSQQEVQEFIDLEVGQQYARVVRSDGDGRFIVVRNDGVVVSALVCGRMWKRAWINKDDIVVISMRDLEYANNKSYGHIPKGDIIAKICPSLYNKLKKIEGFVLLNNNAIKHEDNGTITVIADSTADGGAGDDGFEWDYSGPKKVNSDGEEEDEDDGNESDSSEASHDSRKKEKRKKQGQSRKELSDRDIDNI